MRTLASITAVVLALVLGNVPVAFARTHHHHRHYARHVVVQQQPAFPAIFQMPLPSDVAQYGDTLRPQIARIARFKHRRIYAAVNPREEFTSASTSEGRPRDCYGIQWCGCYLRHHFGIADRSLNLAANWATVGSRTSAHSGAIVVWRHHVGVLQSEVDSHGRAMVLSGNNGSGNRATVRYQRVNNAIAFRQL